MGPAGATRPFLGHGVGLRVPHYARALERNLDVDWVELITENFFGDGGRPLAVLDAVCAEHPVALHGVSLGIGASTGISGAYLDRIERLAERARPVWISDHLCWSHVGGTHTHDLLPLPYTDEALAIVVDNVRRVQDRLGRQILLENVSSYVAFEHSVMPEWEFLDAIARDADCFLLLDVNNILVSAINFEFDPMDYLAGIDGARVHQIHLANHTDRGHYRFDSHRGAVPEPVWDLYEAVLRRFGPIPSSVEWDDDIPQWDELQAQQREAKRRCIDVCGEAP